MDGTTAHLARALVIGGGILAVTGLMSPSRTFAQSAADWQTKAGGKMSFEVASVKRDTGEFRSPNFPFDPGDAYAETGGRLSADFSLLTYITFAY